MATSGPRFHLIQPAAQAFARLPIANAFDWPAIVDEHDQGEWYVVVFRSTRRAGADEAQLIALDDAAHDEASRSPGFVHYFKGPTSDQGDCLSFCIWVSRQAARAATGGPAHTTAAAVVREMYASYRLEFIRLTKRAGASAFDFEPFDAANAGPPGGIPALDASPTRSQGRRYRRPGQFSRSPWGRRPMPQRRGQ